MVAASSGFGSSGSGTGREGVSCDSSLAFLLASCAASMMLSTVQSASATEGSGSVRASRRATASRLPPTAASCTALWPLASLASGSAPASRRISIASVEPAFAAACRAVTPSLLACLTEAPAARRSRRMPALPCPAAVASAVAPRLLAALGSAPPSRSARTLSELPVLMAQRSGGPVCDSSACGFAPAASRSPMDLMHPEAAA
mmetsp:Transcript_24187/g.57622  ORF Transcript_24187/g.57622 Transcript_24187/m.57622 type:complete len:203 (+) Transcript_24187:448-1056(+)